MSASTFLNHDILSIVLRRDFKSFVERAVREAHPGGSWSSAPYLDVLADHVMRIEKGDPAYRRSYVNAPPRCGKSFVLTAAHAAWRLARNPRSKVIIASYSMDAAREHLSTARKIMSAEWFRTCFPETALKSDRSDKVETHLDGFIRATSVDGGLTGMGADLILIDDPMKADDARRSEARQRIIDWYRSTVSSRLNNPKTGAFLLVMQRLHIDDFTVFLRDTGLWRELSLPLVAVRDERFPLLGGTVVTRAKGEILDPERFDETWIKDRKSDAGAASFAAQYQQDPEPDLDAAFRKEWFKTYGELPGGGQITLSIDTGVKCGEEHDFTAIETWKEVDQQHYLVDVIRTKVEMPELLSRVRHLAEVHPSAEIVIEDVNNGAALYQTLKCELSRDRLKPITPKLGKFDRALACVDVIETGRVWLPVDAPWLETFLFEASNFPNGKNDDQVDAMTQYLSFAATRRPPRAHGRGMMQIC